MYTLGRDEISHAINNLYKPKKKKKKKKRERLTPKLVE